jgi:hypothetical protein
MHILNVANFNKIVANSFDVTEKSCRIFQNPEHLFLRNSIITFSNSEYLVASKMHNTAKYYDVGEFS